MFKYIKFLLLPLSCLVFACNTSNNKPLVIQFSADSSKIQFVNIDPAGLAHLKSNLGKDSAYQKLVDVLQTPINDDSISMEMEWPGKLSLLQDTLVYTPDTAFKKGQAYLVETMLNTHFANKKEIARSEVGHQIKRQQQLLLR
jgi:hypothetical protein